MNKLWVVLLAALCIGVLLNLYNGQTVKVRSYVEEELVNENRILNEQQILRDIEEPLSRLVAGIVERDALLIFSIFSDPEKARYVRDGAIYESISSAEKSYAIKFGTQDRSIKRTFEFQDKEYDIINPNTVLFTGIGVLEDEGLSNKTNPWVIAYTIVWVKGPDGWKAINMHISWK